MREDPIHHVKARPDSPATAMFDAGCSTTVLAAVLEWFVLNGLRDMLHTRWQSSANGQDFAGIEDVPRIQRPL